jgi:hypothetical protein
MTKKYSIVVLTLILLVAGFLRIYKLASFPPGLYSDEAVNGNNSLEALETGKFQWFYEENNGREGLFMNISAAAIKLFGNTSWAIRLVSALFGLVAILGTYFLTIELLADRRTALFSAFFLATSFWHIMFSRIAFRAIMAPTFLILAFALLFAASRKKSTVLSAFSGLSFGLGFHSYIAYRIAPLLLIWPLAIMWKKNKKIVFVFLAFAFLSGLPLGWHYIKAPTDFWGRTAQISIFDAKSPLLAFLSNLAKTAGMLFVAGDFNWRHNLAGSPQLWGPVAFLFLVGMLNFKNKKPPLRPAQKPILAAKNSQARKFLLSWIGIMSLPVLMSNEGIPHALRSIIIVPPIMILAGLGLETIFSKTKEWLCRQKEKYPKNAKQISRIEKEIFVLLFVFLVAAIGHSYAKYFLRWGPSVNAYKAFDGRATEIGRYINKAPLSVEKYVIMNQAGKKPTQAPMPSQVVMYLTDSYLQENQKRKKIIYLLPQQINQIECRNKCLIVTLDKDPLLRDEIKNKIPGLKLEIENNFELLIKK